MESNGFSIVITDSLMRYLVKSLPNRTSRFEAFQYLVSRQITKLEADYYGGISNPFLAKVCDLSKQWKWSRNTVFSFLKTLENEDVIKVKQCADGTLILVQNIIPSYQKMSAEQ